MSEEPRGPTPAVYREDPRAELYGTVHPYINYKLGGITPYLSIIPSIQTLSKELLLPLTLSPFNKSQLPTALPKVLNMAKDGSPLT